MAEDALPEPFSGTLPPAGRLDAASRPKAIKRDDLVAAMRVALAQFGQQRQLSEQVVDLEEKLTSRKLIDRAKGILMKNGMGEEEAYHAVQMAARSRRTTMSKVAQEVIDNGKI